MIGVREGGKKRRTVWCDGHGGRERVHDEGEKGPCEEDDVTA